MGPEIWGPPLWYKMHMKTFNYPDNPSKRDKMNVIQYFKNVPNIMPCEKCIKHYKRELIINPVENVVHSRKSLIKWLVDFHNKVNVRLGKSTFTYKQAYALYSQPTNDALIIPSVLCATILLFIGFKR